MREVGLEKRTMNKNSNRKRIPSRQKTRKKGFASFFVFLVLINLAVFFLKNKNKIGDNDEVALIGQEIEEKEVTEKEESENVEESVETQETTNLSFFDSENRPVFDSDDPEDWIRNLEIAKEDYPNAQIILDHRDEISPSTLRLVGNNFSAIDFVAKTFVPEVEFHYSYPVNLNGVDFPYYLQWDERWAFENYAGNYLGYSGCGPTSVAMALSGVLNDDSITPVEIAKLSEENGFSYSGGTDWGLFPFVGNHYGVTVEKINMDEETVFQHLKEGHGILVSVKPGDFTLEGHIMLITGTDLFKRLIIHDPNSKDRSEKRWSVQTVLDQSKAMWAIYE